MIKTIVLVLHFVSYKSFILFYGEDLFLTSRPLIISNLEQDSLSTIKDDLAHLIISVFKNFDFTNF